MTDQPVGAPVPQEIVQLIVDEYQAQADDNMGHLHNRFVGYIAEAQVPLTHVIAVLQMLLHEATVMAMHKYRGA